MNKFSFDEVVDPTNYEAVRTAFINDLQAIASECSYSTLGMRARFPFPLSPTRQLVQLSQTLKFSCDNELVLMYPGVKDEISNAQQMFTITSLYAGHGMISLIPYALRSAICNSFVDVPIIFPSPNVVWGRLRLMAKSIPPANLPEEGLSYLISQSLSPSALNLAGNLSHTLLQRAILPAIFACIENEIFSDALIEEIACGVVVISPASIPSATEGPDTPARSFHY